MNLVKELYAAYGLYRQLDIFRSGAMRSPRHKLLGDEKMDDIPLATVKDDSLAKLLRHTAAPPRKMLIGWIEKIKSVA